MPKHKSTTLGKEDAQAEFLIKDVLRTRSAKGLIFPGPDWIGIAAGVRTIMSFLSSGHYFDFIADIDVWDEVTTIHFGGESTEEDVRKALIAFHESLWARDFRDVDWRWNSHDSDHGVRVMTEDKDIPLEDFCQAAEDSYNGE